MSVRAQEWGAVSINPANPPTINWAYGCFPLAAASYTRNGAGDYSIALASGFDIAANEIADVQFCDKEAAAASGLVTFGWADTSNTSKRVTILKEGAAGAASALTDITGPVIVRVWKRPTQT